MTFSVIVLLAGHEKSAAPDMTTACKVQGFQCSVGGLPLARKICVGPM